MTASVPIYLLSGFLGSGKTTLLNHALESLIQSGIKPAIVINEIGDVNIDGQIIEREVPMSEILNGCICCTLSGDLSLTIYELCRDHRPDLILVEASGVANPLELINSVSEASLFYRTELKQIVTVVDAPSFLELQRGVKGRIYRLMMDQLKAANYIVLNKMDRISVEDLNGLQTEIKKWNPYASITLAEYCQDSLLFLQDPISSQHSLYSKTVLNVASASTAQVSFRAEKGKDVHTLATGHNIHRSHDFMMAHTYYFEGAVNREGFERFLQDLPANVFRAKGILSFAGEKGQHLFQMAFGQQHIFLVRPRVFVPNVIVLIGDHFSKADMEQRLRQLEVDRQA